MSKKRTIWAKTLRQAAADVKVDASTLSRWARCSDFTAGAHTARGWHIPTLRAYKTAKAQRSLDPSVASNGDPAIADLVQQRDALRTALLTLRADCIRQTVCDKARAFVVVERFIGQTRQAFRNGLRAVGGLCQDWALHDAMEYQVYPKVLKHIFRGWPK